MFEGTHRRRGVGGEYLKVHMKHFTCQYYTVTPTFEHMDQSTVRSHPKWSPILGMVCNNLAWLRNQLYTREGC